MFFKIRITIVYSFSVHDCKAKWHSLRTSYARYLRESRKGSVRTLRRKKWYLADAMNFLHNFAGNPKIVRNNILQSDHDYLDSNSESWNDIIITKIKKEHSESNSSLPSCSSPQNDELVENNTKDQDSQPPVETDDESMPTYINSCNRTSMITKAEEDPMLSFFKSVLPDVKKFNPRRQRYFKSKVLSLVNSLADEEEDEIVKHSSMPNSGFSACSAISIHYDQEPSLRIEKREKFDL